MSSNRLMRKNTLNEHGNQRIGSFKEQVELLTDTVGGVNTDTSAPEFCEACYGDPHQINVTGSNGVDEGEEVDGRT